MEKQHNRGQDGAGLASIKLNTPPGVRFISRNRSNQPQPLKDLFSKVYANFEEALQLDTDLLSKPDKLYRELPYTGEILVGHLRYGTHGGNTIEHCHPFLRQNNWKTRNLVLAGNFNLTNTDELFQTLVELGQHPKEMTDTVTMLEKIGHFLDEENDRLFQLAKANNLNNKDISEYIANHMDVARILQRASRNWDGGYTMVGLIGHGDAFVLRDPNGIRPAYFYADDEIVVAASEKPVIQTAFNLSSNQVLELPRGNALIVKKQGHWALQEILTPNAPTFCSFERIYFSRGNDQSIYQERKELGRLLVPSILKAINYNLANTVFSYIPNTAETAFLGLIKGVEDYLDEKRLKELPHFFETGQIEEAEKLLKFRPRVEKAAIKDAKLRTFITNESGRDDLVAHVYDITYGIINEGVDQLVVIDDSIVRGTTLKKSILRMLDRLKPKKIVIVSSAPQIRYPDCYGIDMSKLGDFVAFRALIQLLENRNWSSKITDAYNNAILQLSLPKEQQINALQPLYALFTEDEISKEIAEIVKPIHLQAELEIIFQPLNSLKLACPSHTGDWYFSGNYPTAGGNKVVNKAFVNFVEGINSRAY